MGIIADYKEVRKKYVIRRLEKKQQKYGRLRLKMRDKGLAVVQQIERVRGIPEDMLTGKVSRPAAEAQPTKAKK